MRSSFKRITLALTGVAALVGGTFPMAPRQAQAVEQPQTLASAYSEIDANLSGLNQEAASLNGQTSEVTAKINQLEAERAALEPVLEQKKQLLRESMRQSYMAGEKSSLEVIASNKTFSGVVSTSQYNSQISEKAQSAQEQLAETKQQLDTKIAEASQKREGLVALKGQLDEKIATAEAQAEARRQLAIATQNKEEEYQKLVKDEQQKETLAMAELAASTPSPAAPRPAAPVQRPSAPSFSGPSGQNPFPWGQCTYYVASQRGGWQYGNAGTWSPNSSTPGIGKIMIMRPGFGGARAAGHVGIVVGINGNQIALRHMNWKGLGVVSTDTVPNSGLFIN